MDALRTQCASIPVCELCRSQPAALVRELRSVPPPLLRRSRSSRQAGDPLAGHGGEGFIATLVFEAFVATAKKQDFDTPDIASDGRQDEVGIAGCLRTVDTRVLGPERLSTFVARIPRGSARHALRRICEVASWTAAFLRQSIGLVPSSAPVG